MPTAIKTQGYGWRPDLPDPRDRIYNLEFTVKRGFDLPPKVSLRSGMPPVYNQGELGSCTANGSGAAIEYAEKRQHETEGGYTPSRLFIYYNERRVEGSIDQDSGAQVRTALKVLNEYGAPPENDWPYDIGRFTVQPSEDAYNIGKQHRALQYHRILPGGAGASIRTALAQGLPVVFGFTVPEMFEEEGWNPATSYLPLPSPHEQFIGGHCVLCTGYDFSREHFHDQSVYEVRNSWGEGWGEGGYFWMDHRWLDEPERLLSSDFWVIQKAT